MNSDFWPVVLAQRIFIETHSRRRARFPATLRERPAVPIGALLTQGKTAHSNGGPGRLFLRRNSAVGETTPPIDLVFGARLSSTARLLGPKKVNFGPFPPDAEAPLAPRDWHLSFESEIESTSMVTTASLSREERTVCRFISAGPIGPELNAREMLVRKARIWVAAYLQRPHTGSTEFGALYG